LFVYLDWHWLEAAKRAEVGDGSGKESNWYVIPDGMGTDGVVRVYAYGLAIKSWPVCAAEC
jgi:hypothetical protein